MSSSPPPNNSFKPNLLRYTKHMAEKACHVFGSTTQVGLTQALGVMGKSVVVVGTGFANRDGRNRADIIRRFCRPGVALTLVREPDNPHDRSAVAVYVERPKILGILGGGNVQLGYIREGTAKSLAKRLDAGKVVRAAITSMYAPPNMQHPRVSAELTYHDA